MHETALIVGVGEVGLSLAEVLGSVHDLALVDQTPSEPNTDPINVMHICFPYSREFPREVQRYRQKYRPQRVVIHSSVPPGTSRVLGASHSPVVGIHPHLAESLRTFTKFISGKEASAVAEHFRAAGIKVYLFDAPETTEAMKLLSTAFYALCIEYTKEVKQICDVLGIPFEAWTLWTENYNRGYRTLGRPEYARPNLIPTKGRLGGHCLLANCELLESDFTQLIKRRNKK